MEQESPAIYKSEESLEERGKNYFQIDLLKAIMICFVIFDHAVHSSIRFRWGAELWERMAIPVFLIIMGFNMGKSFKRKGVTTLKQLYSWSYFKGKFWRFMFPFLIFYSISTVIGFLIYGPTFSESFRIMDNVFLGLSPFLGPGNWFIPVLFGAILIMPLLYYCFNKKPKITLILCFAIEILMHLIVFLVIGEISSFEEWELELYFRYNILLYLSAIGLGLWFSKEHDIFNKKNRFVWILFPISLLYLIAYQFFNFRLSIDGAHIVRGDYNYLVFPYSAFVILLALKYIPKNVHKRTSKALAAIGKASFHIYLTQDIYFAISYTLNGYPRVANVFGISVNIFVNTFYLIINWVICITIGVLWWYSENKIRKHILDKRKLRKSGEILVKDEKFHSKPAKEKPLIVYILYRAVASFGMVLGVIVFIFLLTRMLPGDPVLMRMPRSFTQERYDRMAAKLGLDQPVPIQLLIYIKDVLLGNWGYSMTVVRDSLVWDVVLQRFPRTLEIMFISMPIAILLGVKLGKVSGANRDKRIDQIIRVIIYIGVSVPGFVIGLYLLGMVTATKIVIFPYHGYKTPGMLNPPPITHSRIIDSLLAGDFYMFADYLWHLCLPVASMIIYQMVIIARQTRASYINVLQLDYIRTAEAKGCTKDMIINRHAFRNAIPPSLTVMGMGFPRVFAGSVAIEVAFNLAGMGQLFLRAIHYRDYTIMIAIIYLCALVVITFNFLVDVLYAVVDPRVKYR